MKYKLLILFTLFSYGIFAQNNVQYNDQTKNSAKAAPLAALSGEWRLSAAVTLKIKPSGIGIYYSQEQLYFAGRQVTFSLVCPVKIEKKGNQGKISCYFSQLQINDNIPSQILNSQSKYKLEQAKAQCKNSFLSRWSNPDPSFDVTFLKIDKNEILFELDNTVEKLTSVQWLNQKKEEPNNDMSIVQNVFNNSILSDNSLGDQSLELKEEENCESEDISPSEEMELSEDIGPSGRDSDPEFPGGDRALKQFISSNLRYPIFAVENGIQGRVTLSLVIDRDGSIYDIKVIRSPSEYLTQEAKRVVRLMPKWKPGKKDGKPIRMDYQVPFTFILN